MRYSLFMSKKQKTEKMNVIRLSDRQVALACEFIATVRDDESKKPITRSRAKLLINSILSQASKGRRS